MAFGIAFEKSIGNQVICPVKRLAKLSPQPGHKQMTDNEKTCFTGSKLGELRKHESASLSRKISG